MKRGIVSVLVFLVFGIPVCAQDSYHIEVLQVSKINPFDWVYEGFVEELENNGIVQGQNLVINRHIIDAGADVGLWKKIGVLMKIKGAASDIVAAKPDLVLTISTPATKYSKDRFIGAGVPVVFSAVAVPETVGCKSVSRAGPGFTGASLYLDPISAFKITKLALPNLTRMGIVHSDDDNAVAFVEEAKAKAAASGITILSRQVEKSDSPIAAARDLVAQGVQAFGVPLDAYYGLRNYQPTREFHTVVEENNIPTVSFCLVGHSGSILYIGSDFKRNGALAGAQAVKILKDDAKPETLPILAQEDLTILVDVDAMKKRGVELPMEILKIAREVTSVRD